MRDADGQLVHVHDITEEPEEEFPISKAFAKQMGHRTMLAAPLLRQGDVTGAIFVRRTEVRPFSDSQIALLKIFADQAVIAIENARLFEEVQARTREATERARDLSEALEQQTATSEILSVIAGSPTDVQPVFETIAKRAAKLCGAELSVVCRFDGELIHVAAHPAIEGTARRFRAAISKGA